jgi:hypothetical protein
MPDVPNVKAVRLDAAGGQAEQAPGWAFRVAPLKIPGGQSSVFRNPRKHLGSQFLPVMK